MIALPSNVQWVGDIGVFVVEGIRKWRESIMDAGGSLAPVFLAPEAWAQYDKRCDRPMRSPAGDYHDDSCDCGPDGRQVWEVRWPCPHPAAVCAQSDCPGFLSARATITVEQVPAGFVGAHWGDALLDRPPRPGRDFVVVVRKAAL